MVLDLVNNGIEMNKSTWAIACGALQTVRTSQDMARLEAKFFPATKGNMSLSNKTRRFEASSANVIVANFAKVEEDKKTGVKSLADLQSVDVSILLGNYAAAAAASDDGADEEGAEE
jgi:phosphoribosylformylglycinamidine (FGAM) synthase-like enzyme